VGVQLGQVLHPWHRCGPVALQVPHAPLDVRLLLRLAYQAEQRLKGEVTAQRQVAFIEAPLATCEQLRCHRLGIVPPHFPRHTAEELEALHQAVPNGLSPLRRQGHCERTVRVRPSEQQHRHLASALGEVRVDVAEVRFETLARIVVQRDERLAPPRGLPIDIAADPVVAAGVAVLVAQPPVDLGSGVLLLGRRRHVGLQDHLDHRLERIEDRRHWSPLIRLGFGLGEDLANLASRMMKPPRQFADAHLVNGVGSPNTCILVHRHHPLPPCSWNTGQ
jgi:hypothetical protein